MRFAAFARAFSARARLAYDGASSFEIYLTGIARTVALSKLRARDGDNNTRAVRLADHERVRRALLDLQRAFIAGLDDDERSLLFARVERHATAGLAPLRARKVERTLRTRFVELMHEKSHAEQRLSSRG